MSKPLTLCYLQSFTATMWLLNSIMDIINGRFYKLLLDLFLVLIWGGLAISNYQDYSRDKIKMEKEFFYNEEVIQIRKIKVDNKLKELIKEAIK